MLGFDYGTSNCALGIMSGDKPELISLADHGTYMPSSLYAPSRDVIVNWLQQQLCPGAKTEFAALRRFQLQKGQSMLRELALDDIPGDLFFGKQALNRYLEDPSEGYYIKSPKSFLGASGLKPQQIALFEDIVAAMMAHVKQLAEQTLQQDLHQVVIGRPVNFQGLKGEESNKQAIDVLTNAARRVGYRDIEFQFEPIAAGFEFEASLNRETRVLVVDIGGGTTDISMQLMGPELMPSLDRSPHLLGHSGQRIGGNDFDIQLALKGIMPELGMDSLLKTGKPMPVNSYREAVAINNINAQTEFYSAANGRLLQQLKRDAEQPERVEYLVKVHQEKLSYQLVNSAEQAKIALSDSDSGKISLDYLDNRNRDMTADVNRQLLLDAATRELTSISELMQDTVLQAGCQPDAIFVTGGTAKSPVLREYLQAQYPDSQFIVGDNFGSVTAGLTRWSRRIFA
ncbi:molecular chaperone [Thalassomonas haliotis]|uniref:Molecular chaperone n=1 Tax=Thalassomonas haliotis TaxID=485448 RepID=A0ABY7VBS2_9GAMM|nr:molecular chaperone [Thalassomonas haliotis]WDE10785.1 molecular chaperone [Thalassomonas haliotis]